MRVPTWKPITTACPTWKRCDVAKRPVRIWTVSGEHPFLLHMKYIQWVAVVHCYRRSVGSRNGNHRDDTRMGNPVHVYASRRSTEGILVLFILLKQKQRCKRKSTPYSAAVNAWQWLHARTCRTRVPQWARYSDVRTSCLWMCSMPLSKVLILVVIWFLKVRCIVVVVVFIYFVGTTVIGQISSIHEDEKYFKNAKEFNPQRFIDNPECLEKVNWIVISINSLC